MPDETRSKEMDSRSGMRIPSVREAARLLGRAFLLRCPNCGGGPVLKNWLKLRVSCGRCCIRFERGEHDYFMGSMLLNYCLTGSLLLGVLAMVIVARWPNVPWTGLQYGGPLAMIVVPFILFPFSKLLWLAADMLMRPVTPEEMEWHRTSTEQWSSERAPRTR